MQFVEQSPDYKAIEISQLARDNSHYRVYISGPISKNPHYKEAFLHAVAQVSTNAAIIQHAVNQHRGGDEVTIDIYNPAEMPAVLHDPDRPCWGRTGSRTGHHTNECYLHHALFQLILCDAIYMMPDWRWSVGASLEHQIATKTGMKIFYAPDPNQPHLPMGTGIHVNLDKAKEN